MRNILSCSVVLNNRQGILRTLAISAGVLLLLTLLTVNTALGQSCPTEGNGGHTIGGDVGDNANGVVLPSDAIYWKFHFADDR